jgi:hypothetical protein
MKGWHRWTHRWTNGGAHTWNGQRLFVCHCGAEKWVQMSHVRSPADGRYLIKAGYIDEPA